MALVCLGAAYWLSAFRAWELTGPLLMFLGLLTLINAPFDWASLGLTRALLRRRLELGGCWPTILAFVDAALAALIVALLALAMVIGMQAFHGLAAQGGGIPVLPLGLLLRGIATNPSAPEYWWAYALLLSTLIPSRINLMIGATSLLRGAPGVPNLLLRLMPAGQAVAKFDRAWIALALTAQAFFGVIAGILVQAFLVIAVVFHIMPWLELGLPETLRAVAEFDLPMRIINLF